MEQYAGFAGHRGDLTDRLLGPQFIVRVHDGDQHGIGPQCSPDIIGRHDTGGADLDERDFGALLFEFAAGLQNGRVVQSCS